MKQQNLSKPLPLPKREKKDHEENNNVDEEDDEEEELSLVWARDKKDDPIYLDTTRRNHTLRHKRSQHKKRISRLIRGFDNALQRLRTQKFDLDSKITFGKFKADVLREELVVIQAFEERDNALLDRVNSLSKEQLSIAKEIEVTEDKVATKMDDVSTWESKNTDLLEECKQLISGLSSEIRAELLKVYHRKIKRQKNRDGDGESDGESEEESDDDMSDDDFSDDEEREETCPAGCKTEIFEKVKQLRERRLDQTEVLNAYRKSLVDVKKSLNRYHARERQIVKDMEKAHYDIEALHTEKQQEMNKIRVVVPLRLSQLCAVNDNTLPEDSSECIVVDKNEIDRLKVQIGRHVEEKKSHSAMFKDLRRHHKKLGRDTAVKEKEILKLESKCQKIQLLKFGHELNLESLDKMTVNKSVVEIQKKVKIQTSKDERSKRKYREQMKTAQEMQFEATKRNTELLTRLAELTARVQEIDAAVKKNDFESKTDKPGLTNKDIKDRKRLVQLLRIQAREIDALKAEINSIRTSKI